MAKYASGKFAKRISDRSGMAFPYNEMVKEWNGSTVHISEFERKHPQLEPLPIISDPEALENARPQEQHTIRVFIGRGADTIFTSTSSGGTQASTLAKDLTAKFDLGAVTVS